MSSAWKQEKLTLAHASEKKVCWKAMGWLTDCKDKLLSSSSERTGAQAACNLGGRNLLGTRKDHHIHFLFLLLLSKVQGERPNWPGGGSGRGTLTDSPSRPIPWREVVSVSRTRLVLLRGGDRQGQEGPLLHAPGNNRGPGAATSP